MAAASAPARLGAVVLAGLLVVGGLFVRGQFDDDEPASDTGDAPEAVANTGDPICATAFGELCSVTFVSDRARTAGSIADRLIAADTAADLDADTWIIPRAWAELVVAERERLGQPPILTIEDEALASTPILLVVWEDRQAQLAPGCGGVVDWRCVGTRVSETLAAGDRLRAAGPAIDQAAGLAVAGAQAAGLLGRSDFAANDFDAAFRSAATALAAEQRRSPLEDMRTRGPGELTVVGVAAVDAPALTSNFGTLLAEVPAPAVRMDVVVVTTAGGLDPQLRTRLSDAFQASGWEPGGSGDDGLPPGGVLAAIRTLWSS